MEREEEQVVEKRKENGVEKRGKCFRPGLHALAKIGKYQKSSDLLIRRLPFVRYCLKYALMQ